VLFAGVCLAGVCFAAETAAAPVVTPLAPALELCSNTPGATACQGPKKDLKAAHKAFQHGLKLEKSHDLQEAFYEFQAAADLVPQNVEYLTAREITRQHLAGIHLEKGNHDPRSTLIHKTTSPCSACATRWGLRQ
jgi:hypothetical protein